MTEALNYSNRSLVDVLCPGTLVIRSATLGAGPMLKWVPDDPSVTEAANKLRLDSTGYCNDKLSEGVKFGSLNDREWTIVSDGLDCDTDGRSVMLTLNNGGEKKKDTSGKMVVRPIHVELSELKSFQLCDDGNQLVLIQKDGTKNNPLIFLDEGPEQLIEVFRRYVYYLSPTRIPILMFALKDFLDCHVILYRYMCVRQSASDENLYLLTDARMEALDKSLSQLKLFDPKNTDAVWKFASDFQRDPYSTAMTAFSKITEKLIFR